MVGDCFRGVRTASCRQVSCRDNMFLAEVKRYIQKVYDLLVCFDGNLKTVFLEYSADFFLDVLSHSGCGICDS